MKPLPLALTMGEPAGIGGEIAIKAWLRRAEGVPPFYVIDDPERLAAIANQLGWNVPVIVLDDVSEAGPAFARALPVRSVGGSIRAGPGRPDPADAPLVIRAIETAVADVQAGRAAALVTNPINKDALYRAGFRHPGHTEFLAELAGIADGPVMMLAGPQLRVVPVTIHLALRAAIEKLSEAAIVHAGRVTHAALIRDFGDRPPVIAVAGLNPHAGEGGALGREEIEIVAPAIAALRRRGHRGARPARGGYDVSRRRKARLRCGAVHVSRPGADPGQDARFRRGRQRDAGIAVYPHLARSRHRVRYRRNRVGTAGQPDRRAETRCRYGRARVAERMPGRWETSVQKTCRRCER